MFSRPGHLFFLMHYHRQLIKDHPCYSGAPKFSFKYDIRLGTNIQNNIKKDRVKLYIDTTELIIIAPTNRIRAGLSGIQIFLVTWAVLSYLVCALHVSWFVQNYIFDGTILMTTTPLGDKSEKLGRIIIRNLPIFFFFFWTHKTPDGYVLKIDINSYWNALQRLTILMR